MNKSRNEKIGSVNIEPNEGSVLLFMILIVAMKLDLLVACVRVKLNISSTLECFVFGTHRIHKNIYWWSLFPM